MENKNKQPKKQSKDINSEKYHSRSAEFKRETKGSEINKTNWPDE